MRPPATLAEQAADRELAALVDGPRTLRWFWRDDLEGMQAAARRMGHPLEAPPTPTSPRSDPTGNTVGSAHTRPSLCQLAILRSCLGTVLRGAG